MAAAVGERENAHHAPRLLLLEAMMTWAEHSHGGTRVVRRGLEPFSLEEVRRLDAEAVRSCDGFEFRYHQGGAVTWREMASSREIRVPVMVGVPHDEWRHLERCGCQICRESAPSRHRAAKPSSPAARVSASE